MGFEENKLIAKKFFDEILVKRNFEAAYDLIHEDYNIDEYSNSLQKTIGLQIKGPQGFLERSQKIIELKEIRSELINIVGDDDVIILEFFWKIKPGKLGDLIIDSEMKSLSYQSFGFRDGKIVSSRLVRDLNPLLESGNYNLEHSEKIEDYLNRLKSMNLA